MAADYDPTVWPFHACLDERIDLALDGSINAVTSCVGAGNGARSFSNPKSGGPILPLQTVDRLGSCSRGDSLSETLARSVDIQ
jgi:hypothetical protein